MYGTSEFMYFVEEKTDLSTGTVPETTLGAHHASFAVDVGDYLVIPDNLWYSNINILVN